MLVFWYRNLLAAESPMRLTNFFDYTLRLLMYAATHSDRLITVEETAGVYGISRTHLMKVANQLTREGYLKAVRGRSGGLTLAKRPNRIKLGDVLCATEPDFALVECFSDEQPLSDLVALSPASAVEGSAGGVHSDS